MRRNTILVALALAVAAGSPVAAQSTLLVPTPQYPTIQSAINAANQGLAGPGSRDTVLVAAGIYVEVIDFLGKAITVQGQGPGASIIDGNRLASVVTFVSNEGPYSVLDGFTIRNGRGSPYVSGPFAISSGGGIFIDGSLPTPGSPPTGPTISNCEITGNIATTGGGIACYTYRTPIITSCHIHDNTTIDPTLPGVGNGGGIAISIQAAPTISNCVIDHNSSGNSGGIVDGGGGVQETIINDSVIANNTALVAGGALSCDSPISLNRCVIRDNQASVKGGGIFFTSSYSPTLINCLITGNTANEGAAFYGEHTGTDLTATHCTIAANTAGPQGAAVYLKGFTTHARLTSSILWANTPAAIKLVNNATLIAAGSDLQDGYPGIGSFDADPLFVDPTAGDFHLRIDSPCVNAASATLASPPALDIDGEPRSLFGAPDVGADEVSDIALHPCMAGTVGLGAGGPFDLLRINGNAGGFDRRVDVPIGFPISFLMLQPPTNPSPVRFAIFGTLAIPTFRDPFTLPGATGTMAFPPCLALPSAQPFLFTLADNLGAAGPCGPLLPSTPAVWTSGPLPGVPFPFDLTLQGVVEETAGVARVTNGVIVVVR